jgi:hypothetical protein
MTSDIDELTRVVGTMPQEMAREVLNFAKYLQRQHARPTSDAADWEEEFDSRYGADAGISGYHPWDAADSPAGAREVA